MYNKILPTPLIISPPQDNQDNPDNAKDRDNQDNQDVGILKCRIVDMEKRRNVESRINNWKSRKSWLS